MVFGGSRLHFLNSGEDCREIKLQGGGARVRASRSYPACVLKLKAQKLGQAVSGTARQYIRSPHATRITKLKIADWVGAHVPVPLSPLQTFLRPLKQNHVFNPAMLRLLKKDSMQHYIYLHL